MDKDDYKFLVAMILALVIAITTVPSLCVLGVWAAQSLEKALS